MDPCYVGIDVAKATLDVALYPQENQWQVPHTEAGLSSLAVQLRERQPALVVLEATGGYEAMVAGLLVQIGLAVVVVNPRGH